MKTSLLLLLPTLMLQVLAAEDPPAVGPPVLDPPSVSPGATVTISVEAQGTGPFTYQWQFKGANLDPAGNPTAAQPILKLSAITPAQEGAYRVIVTNGGGSTTSPEVALDVDPTFSVVQTSFSGNAPPWGGVWADYDGDGDPDLLLGHMSMSTEAPLQLHRQNGDGTFTQVDSLEAGPLLGFGALYGTYTWADYDNDRDPDVALGYFDSSAARSRLFRNEGGRFVEMTSSQVGPFVTGANAPLAWADYDNDGFLDVVGLSFQSFLNGVFHNNGNGRFIQVGADVSPEPSPPFWIISWAAAWSDYDQDGDQDLLMPTGCGGVNLDVLGIGRNYFYRNDGAGKFTRLEGPLFVDTKTVSYGGTWGDYDNDGFMDIFAADMSQYVAYLGGRNQLYHNNRDGTFTPMTDSVVMSEGGQSLAGAFGDYDNDGWLDLFVGNHGWRAYWQGPQDNWPTNSFLYHNNGDGTFTKITTGSPVNAYRHASWKSEGGGDWRSVSWVDYDNDGFLDLSATLGHGAACALYHNSGNANHWLKVRLEGRASNSEGIGAKVRVLATLQGKPVWQLREVTRGNYSSSALPEAHFGLGTATVVDTVRVEWPSGIVQELKGIAPNQALEVVEAQAGADKASTFAAFSRQPDGKFQATAAFGTGLLGVFEGSMDLETWTKIMVRTNTTGTVQFEDRWASTRPLCFYRVLVP